MKRNKILFLIIIICLVITGCGHKKPSNKTIKSKDDLNNKSGSMSCTRETTANDGIKPSCTYKITYSNGNILILHSVEKITTDNTEYLNQYEEAYKKINSYYANLKYYDTKVIREADSVTRDTTINYDKINTDKLLALEGEEDNIIVNGKAKLNKWLKFARKFGTECHED